ncbi:MAG: hypothetical protein IPI97_15245 [Nitrosomonas sp.]|nr:hypothetical protein [Nitrosomonas sp.]
MYLTVIKTFLTAKSAWIKYAAIAILTVMVLAYVYGAGKDSERSEWLGKEAKFLAQQNAIKEAAKKRIEENQAKYDQILMGVINEHNKSIEERDGRIADLNSRGMRISSKNCTGGNRLPTKAKDSGQPDSAAGGGEIRLSDETARGLAEVAIDANEVVEKYNALVKICSPLVEVVE